MFLLVTLICLITETPDGPLMVIGVSVLKHIGVVVKQNRHTFRGKNSAIFIFAFFVNEDQL